MASKKSVPPMRHPIPTSSSRHFTNRYTSSLEMTTSPVLPSLPLEIIQHIFLECSDIESVVNLSATSRQFREAYLSSQKLFIVENALEAQFGPLYDAIQVVAYKPSQNEPVYCAPEPQMTMRLAKRIAKIGYIAKKWEQLYPMLRWRDKTEHRRILNTYETFRFRRALYRHWLYTKAFHNDNFLQAASTDMITACDSNDERLQFISLFDNDEMMELRELNDAFQSMLVNDLCPSDAIIQQRYNEGFPGNPPLYFGSYHTHPFDCTDSECFCRKLELRRDLPQVWTAEAWGPRASQMRIVGRLLKLEPHQLLYFKDDLHNRAERVNYLRKFPESFHRYKSTLEGAMINVMSERDYCMASTHDDIDGGIIDYWDEKPGERYETSKFSIDSWVLPCGLTLADYY